MRTSLNFLVFLALLCSWPATVLAYIPMEPPHLPQPPLGENFLLVASRKLTNPWFRESVVLVTRTGHRGPVGAIINRPRNIMLDKLFPKYPAAANYRLFTGGPLSREQISYVFRGEGGATGSLQVSKHVYLSYSASVLGELLDGTRAHTGLRVMNGLAAWAPGQLENEIARGDWYVLPVDEEIILDFPAEKIWPEMLRRAMTTRYYAWRQDSFTEGYANTAVRQHRQYLKTARCPRWAGARA